jgi:hypothetical protein
LKAIRVKPAAKICRAAAKEKQAFQATNGQSTGMKIGARIGIGLGITSFLFASYTAVKGPIVQPKTDEVTQERIAEIQASSAKESGEGCCARKTEDKETAAHQSSDCGKAGEGDSCPSHK